MRPCLEPEDTGVPNQGSGIVDKVSFTKKESRQEGKIRFGWEIENLRPELKEFRPDNVQRIGERRRSEGKMDKTI